MRNNIIAVFLVFITSFTLTGKVTAQKLGSYEAKWNPGLALDDDESLINRMQYDEKSTFMFLVSNNEEQLFIDIVLSDQAAIQKVMRYGLTTWLNTEGKTKKGTGIVFPRSPEETGEPVFKKEKGGDRKAMMMAMMETKNREMELIGFEGKGISTIIDPRVDSLFDGKVEMKEGGKLHVSLVLPLSKIGRGKATSLYSPISVGFETGYMDVTGQGPGAGGSTQGGGGMQGGGGGMPGGGGGMYGGGPPPSAGSSGEQRGGGQQPDISKLASPSKLWIKELKLAEKP
jgi:hypothetical protein